MGFVKQGRASPIAHDPRQKAEQDLGCKNLGRTSLLDQDLRQKAERDLGVQNFRHKGTEAQSFFAGLGAQDLRAKGAKGQRAKVFFSSTEDRDPRDRDTKAQTTFRISDLESRI